MTQSHEECVAMSSSENVKYGISMFGRDFFRTDLWLYREACILGTGNPLAYEDAKPPRRYKRLHPSPGIPQHLNTVGLTRFTAATSNATLDLDIRQPFKNQFRNVSCDGNFSAVHKL